jgi:hypothetical protein
VLVAGARNAIVTAPELVYAATVAVFAAAVSSASSSERKVIPVAS